MKRLSACLLALAAASPVVAASPASSSTAPSTASPSKSAGHGDAPSAGSGVSTAGRGVIALNLPTSGAYLAVVASPGEAGQALEPPISVNGPKAAVELPDGTKKGAKVVLSVLQSAGQLMARQTMEVHGPAESITLKAADFDRIAALPVEVTSGGKAVSAALVELDGPGGAVVGRVSLLPGQGGLATFQGVPSGKDTIKVSYNDGQTATQEITVDPATAPEKRKAEVTVAGATLTEPLKAASGGAAAATPAGTPVAPPTTPANDSSLLGFLVALAMLAGLIYGGVVYFRNRPEVLRGLLGRLPLPDDEPEPLRPAAPPPVNVPPGTCPFCGAMKDPVTGACECALPVGAAVGSTAGASPGSGPRLIGLSGPLSGQAIPLGPLGITLGREAANDVALGNDPMASRRHARVEDRDGAFAVHDEGSSNGTFVNGSRVTDAPLRPGDELTIGQSRFRYEE